MEFFYILLTLLLLCFIIIRSKRSICSLLSLSLILVWRKILLLFLNLFLIQLH